MKRDQSHPLGVPNASGGGVWQESDDANVVANSSTTGLDRWLARRLVDAMGQPCVALALWDGKDVYTPKGEAVGRVTFRDRRALWSTIVSPELGLGDAFSSGRIEVTGDLVEVLHLTYRSIEGSGPAAFKRNVWGRLPRPKANTRAGSQENIHHHYDLGNDFYKLWLDKEMVYTCAYYESSAATLEQAQLAKMHHVGRKLMLKPGQRVVEAGCGWGSLALHFARHYGVKVTAFNISKEQIAYARQRAKEEGLQDAVDFVQDDYRNISGKFDRFVSVGMLEHVGVENYRELGDVVHRSLASDGVALLHSVGRSRPTPPNAWLERRIFPGSYPPSLREIMNILEPRAFSIIDIENLRLHYAETLMEWLRRFDNNADTIRSMYDENFIRAWRLYLAGCAAAFLASSIQLFQVVFTPDSHNTVPLTRGHLYNRRDGDAWKLD